MKAYDFYAVVYDSSVLCVECLPKNVNVHDESVYPIFANSEWDYYPVCEYCDREHDYVTLLDTKE